MDRRIQLSFCSILWIISERQNVKYVKASRQIQKDEKLTIENFHTFQTNDDLAKI